MLNRKRIREAEAAVFASMTDAELEAIAAGIDPAVEQAIRNLSNQELQAIIDGSASPALLKKIHGETK